jgi:S-adenosylmethionine synthetase
MSEFVFTSESVTEGHPDKICDQISDAVLDKIIAEDPTCRVACETLVKTGYVNIAGEITTTTYADLPTVVRDTVKKIGYVSSEMGFDYQTCAVLSAIEQQSPDIARGVEGRGAYSKKTQGAGDQGMMFGYAVDESPELMPLTIELAHKLCRQLAKMRKNGKIDFLRPDGKSQVSVRYVDGVPRSIENVVISTQHAPDAKRKQLVEAIRELVIKPIVPENMLHKKTKYYINPTGRFVTGGPMADSGLTGRKVIVDTYGGWGRHGGGCFSGKDPSKVDRSATYYARYIAKNIVAAKLAYRCEVQIAYAIGVARPVSILVNSFGTGVVGDDTLTKAVSKVFDCRPGAIVQELDLLKPIYSKTAAYGHFGRREKSFTWEKTDRKAELKEAAGLKKTKGTKKPAAKKAKKTKARASTKKSPAKTVAPEKTRGATSSSRSTKKRRGSGAQLT